MVHAGTASFAEILTTLETPFLNFHCGGKKDGSSYRPTPIPNGADPLNRHPTKGGSLTMCG